MEMIDIGKSELNKIKHLWIKLNIIHYSDSLYWKDDFLRQTFEKRIGAFEKIEENEIKISIITDNVDIFGYCISTIKDSVGEIESIYLDEIIRNNKYGQALINKHLEWFKSRGCEKINVSVSHGHDSVLGFYNKMGFYERRIELRYKEKTSS